MSPQPFATAAGIAAAVRSGSLSAVEAAQTALARIRARDGALNCFTAVTERRALAEAAAIDADRAAGRPPGPLAGVPYGVKNLFDVAGLATLAGSAINRDRPAAGADAHLVARLRAAGAVLVGAQNMDEYAYGFTTENAHYGPTRNPHDPGRVAGGSSGGSAAAVAAGLVPLSLGSDTNGSIRVPSSFCGIFGLKPTYGRLGRGGSFPFVGSLDHVGPFARTVEDLALAYDALQGPDPRDPAQAARPVEPALPLLERGAEGLRVAVLGGWFARQRSAEAERAVGAAAAGLGATRTVELAEAERARAAAFLITMTEGGTLHLDDLRTRAGDFDPATRDRLLAGALLPAAWVIQAQRFRRWFHDRVLELFREADVLIAPSTPVPAPRIGQETMVLDGVEMPVRPNLGLFTQPLSFIGLPIAAVPIPGAGSLPVGVQLIAAPWAEATALRAARALEAAGIAVALVP